MVCHIPSSYGVEDGGEAVLMVLDVVDVDVVAAFAVAGPFAAKPTCILPASKTTNCDLMNISPRMEKPIPASL